MLLSVFVKGAYRDKCYFPADEGRATTCLIVALVVGLTQANVPHFLEEEDDVEVTLLYSTLLGSGL